MCARGLEKFCYLLLTGCFDYSTGFLQQPVPARTELCRLIGQRWEMQDNTDSLSADERTAVNQLKTLLFNASANV